MSRRSTSQKILDERAFAVRLVIVLPRLDRMDVTREMHEWLQRNLALRDYAWHPTGREPGRERSALYFRDPETAAFRPAARTGSVQPSPHNP